MCALVFFGGCGVAGLNMRQRTDAIRFGKSLSLYGQLLTAETTLIRSEVKEMRVLAVSLPGPASVQLFQQGDYMRLGHGLDEERCEQVVQIGGATQDLGDSLAKAADPTTSGVEEQLFRTAASNFVLTVLHTTQVAAGVSLGASAANLFTFALTDFYRKQTITQTMADSEPAAKTASAYLAHEFDPKDETSLLSLYSDATDRLGTLLEAEKMSLESSNLPADEREIVANAQRLVARNRVHIHYVTSQMAKLSAEAERAYDNLLADLTQGNSDPSSMDSFSDHILKTRLAFMTLS